jgi:hypothetical protein
MRDPVGQIVSELRAALAADGGTWPVVVRGGRRADGDTIPLVIVRLLSRTRARTDAIRWRLVTLSVDADPRLASILDERVSVALHNVGPRLKVYRSAEEVGGQENEDPDTGWSMVSSIWIVHASTA